MGPFVRPASADRRTRPRPKHLDQQPVAFGAAGTGAGLVLTPSKRRAGAARGPAGSATASSDDRGERVTSWPTVEPDPLVRARALALAARLSLPRSRNPSRPRRGAGRLATMAYADGASDLDLERTVERLITSELHRPEDMVVRDRVRRRRSVVLAVDVSGSMRGDRALTAAAAVAGLASELARDDLALVAFWSDAAVLLPLGAPIRPLALVDALLRLPAEGLTNLSWPLEVAAEQLRLRGTVDSRVVLLSDCLHNAGPDPRLAAWRLPRVDVLLDRAGDCDPELARDLAKRGRGRLAAVADHRDLPRAVRTLFAH